ncbi:MAG: hypothetical protein FJ027_05060 [Candidatus Rokubacteria bacterium]|nr:hypothetical protein [Candidatus Rokubacteria bacterium]
MKGQHAHPRGRPSPAHREPAPSALPDVLVERLSDILAAALVADLRERAALTPGTAPSHAPGRYP